MKYDFTTIMERRGHDALAVDALGSGFAPGAPEEGFSPIPMWVADMNFPVLPAIQEHVIRRAEHPAFGYFMPSEEYYRSIIRWQKERNGVEGLQASHIGYENGVLGGLISALAVLCVPGDKVLVHGPAYIGFTHSLKNAGYDMVTSPLRRDTEGIWRMDLADMEQKLRKEKIHTMIFCSPHNPTGRVWTVDEMKEMLALCRKYDVYVISDEIWSDIILTHSPVRHTPLQSLDDDARERTIGLYAPSKTFNLAGLIGSYHIIWNRRLKDAVDKAGSLSHYNNMNVLSMHALIGAYSEEGQIWVDELRQVLSENVRYAVSRIREEWPGVSVSMPEGTYMLFLDCEEWCRIHDLSMDGLLQAGWRVGVAWQDGRDFGGTHTIRMNLALPAALVKEAFDRLRRYVFIPAQG